MISVGVVSSWRGLWVLCDAWRVKAGMSTYVGLVLLVVHVVARPRVGRTSQAAGATVLERAFDWVYSFMLFACSVLVWRGIWYLEDHWFLADLDMRLGLSGWLSLGLGLAVLAFYNSMTSNVAAPVTFGFDTGVLAPVVPVPGFTARFHQPPPPASAAGPPLIPQRASAHKHKSVGNGHGRMGSDDRTTSECSTQYTDAQPRFSEPLCVFDNGSLQHDDLQGVLAGSLQPQDPQQI